MHERLNPRAPFYPAGTTAAGSCDGTRNSGEGHSFGGGSPYEGLLADPTFTPCRPSPLSSHPPHIVTADIFARNGVNIRRLKRSSLATALERTSGINFEINEKRPVRKVSSAIQTRSKTQPLPSQTEFWISDPQRVCLIPWGSPSK
ncbi:hypothetical protein BDM02DRAFT_3124027 [Thelephora ganbajun]|uniref:Uncharacterized protein n=1 Tax=Thelephora ganbajun TaxID=370292 RepID=A0ACB6Z090_THEGA|nr:hypothetical protein BDM02DRAFT_3124027 [Thelephora ganbajun]